MNACIRGVGVDCGRFPYAVYAACGLGVPSLPPHWPRDFMCHAMADSEPYIQLVRDKLVAVDDGPPLPGDLALFRPHRSRCFSHSAIVIDWPTVIHARGVGVHPQVEIASAKEWPLLGSPVRIFSPFHATEDQ